jgi:ribonuclease HI
MKKNKGLENFNYEIYTDGAIFKKLKLGGWAFCVLNNKEIYRLFNGFVLNTTSNRMEMTALINAFDFFISSSLIKCCLNIFSDSQYLVDTLYFQYIKIWENNGWKNSSGIDVKNKDLWLVLQNQERKLKNLGFKIEYHWIRGHSGNSYNVLVDQMAKQAKKDGLKNLKYATY